MGQQRQTFLALANWPHSVEVEDAPEMEAVFKVVTEVRAVRTTYNLPFREILSTNLTDFSSANTTVLASSAGSISRMANTTVHLHGRELASPNWESGTIHINTTSASAGTAPSSASLTVATSSTLPTIHSPVDDGMVSITLPGSFDVTAERARLEKEMAKAEADFKRAEMKLTNDKFVANAGEEAVEEEREKREEAVARKQKILEAIERLKGAA